MSELPCCCSSWLSNKPWALPGRWAVGGNDKGCCSLRRSGLLQRPISYHQTPLPWVPPTFQKAFGASQQGIACVQCLSRGSTSAEKGQDLHKEDVSALRVQSEVALQKLACPSTHGQGKLSGPIACDLAHPSPFLLHPALFSFSSLPEHKRSMPMAPPGLLA